MGQEAWKEYIMEVYAADVEYPWEKYPAHAVFRHRANKKWFALMMEIPMCRLGLAGDAQIAVVNVKCDPLLIASLVTENGFFPAYHMNKAHWITIALDGSADEEKIKWLLDMSFDLTAPKMKRRRIPAVSAEEKRDGKA